MRLFLGIDLPSHIKKKIKNIDVPVDNLHITLKFLGEVDNATKIISIFDKLEFDSFTIETEKVEVKNITWIKIKANPKLTELKNKIDSELPDYQDNHDYIPHITISRNKINPNIENFSFEVNEFFLYRSIQTEQGTEYYKLARFFAKRL